VEAETGAMTIINDSALSIPRRAAEKERHREETAGVSPKRG
jgi:hypothetical protein